MNDARFWRTQWVRARWKIRQSPLSDEPDVPRGAEGHIEDEADGWFFVDFEEPYGVVCCDESELVFNVISSRYASGKSART